MGRRSDRAARSARLAVWPTRNGAAHRLPDIRGRSDSAATQRWLAAGDARFRRAPRERELRLQRAQGRMLQGVRAAGRRFAEAGELERPRAVARAPATTRASRARREHASEGHRGCLAGGRPAQQWDACSTLPMPACATSTRSPRRPSRRQSNGCSRRAASVRGSWAAASEGTSSACSRQALARPRAPGRCMLARAPTCWSGRQIVGDLRRLRRSAPQLF